MSTRIGHSDGRLANDLAAADDPETLPGAPFLERQLEHQARLQVSGIDFQNFARHPEELRHKHIFASYYAMIELLDQEFRPAH